MERLGYPKSECGEGRNSLTLVGYILPHTGQRETRGGLHSNLYNTTTPKPAYYSGEGRAGRQFARD